MNRALASIQNGRLGGRPKGSKNVATLEKQIVLEEIKQRVMRSSGQLINSQMALAQGLQMLYVVRTIKMGKKKMRLRPEVVTDQSTIEKYLAGELDEEEYKYYYLSTKEPDNKALDSLLDRTFDRATQPGPQIAIGVQVNMRDERDEITK